jgi:hypothetical protein
MNTAGALAWHRPYPRVGQEEGGDCDRIRSAASPLFSLVLPAAVLALSDTHLPASAEVSFTESAHCRLLRYMKNPTAPSASPDISANIGQRRRYFSFDIGDGSTALAASVSMELTFGAICLSTDTAARSSRGAAQWRASSMRCAARSRAAVAWVTYRRTPADQSRLLRLLPFGTVLVAAMLPLAAGIYLLVSTAWTAAERVILYPNPRSAALA